MNAWDIFIDVLCVLAAVFIGTAIWTAIDDRRQARRHAKAARQAAINTFATQLDALDAIHTTDCTRLRQAIGLIDGTEDGR